MYNSHSAMWKPSKVSLRDSDLNLWTHKNISSLILGLHAKEEGFKIILSYDSDLNIVKWRTERFSWKLSWPFKTK